MRFFRWIFFACFLQMQVNANKMKILIDGEQVQSVFGGDDDDDESLKPVDLTARNFGEHIGDGNVWLVEFYSPHCVHCIEFSSTYEDIARTYHSSEKHKIKVGRVDGNEERALQSRFSIYAYPSFFVVDGYQVYSFEGSRTKKNMMEYVEGGYKKTDPIPFYSSPMGPMGLMQGALITSGIKMMDLFTWSQETFGLSPVITGGLLFGGLFVSCFLLIVILAVVITPKVKTD